MAEQVVAELLSDPSTPEFVKESCYREALLAYGQAVAECRLLRARWAELDRLDAEEALAAALDEVTDTVEDETRSAAGAMHRVSRSRQRESLSRALHRAESRARVLRADLGLSPLARVKMRQALVAEQFNLARYWEAQYREEQAEG